MVRSGDSATSDRIRTCGNCFATSLRTCASRAAASRAVGAAIRNVNAYAPPPGRLFR